MWEELLLCSSFFRNLTKSHYCSIYFFLLLITLYFISSYTATVAGSCPTIVLLKRENNAKRGCPQREIMPCPSCSHMQDIFFQAQQPVGNDCHLCPWKNPSLPCKYLATLLLILWGLLRTLLVLSTGIAPECLMVCSMTQGVTHSGVWHKYVPPQGNEVWRKGPVSSILCSLARSSLWQMKRVLHRKWARSGKQFSYSAFCSLAKYNLGSPVRKLSI